MSPLSMSTRLRALGWVALMGVGLLGGLGAWSLSEVLRQSQATANALQTESQAMMATKRAQTSFLIQIQEWKNLLIRGNDAKSYERHFGAFSARDADVQRFLAEARTALLALGNDASAVEQLAASHRELSSQYQQAL